eukprot:scaffold926_cov113-Isochrysis_galbana.AAC.1
MQPTAPSTHGNRRMSGKSAAHRAATWRRLPVKRRGDRLMLATGSTPGMAEGGRATSALHTVFVHRVWSCGRKS